MSEQTVHARDLINAVWDAILRLFGEHGASWVDFALIECDPEGGWAVVRCSHKALEVVRASIASITEINEKPVAIHVTGVSGTLKSLRKTPKHSRNQTRI